MATIAADWQVILLLAGFVACMFAMYSLTPIALVLGGSALFNVGLLMSDAYAVIAAIFFFQQTVPFFSEEDITSWH